MRPALLQVSRGGGRGADWQGLVLRGPGVPPVRCRGVLSHFTRVQLLWTVAHQAPLSMGFSRQRILSGLPFPTPGDLSDPGFQPVSLISCIGRWVLYHWSGRGNTVLSVAGIDGNSDPPDHGWAASRTSMWCLPTCTLLPPLSWVHAHRGCRAVCHHGGHTERLVLAGRWRATPREQPPGRAPAPGYGLGAGVGCCRGGMQACSAACALGPQRSPPPTLSLSFSLSEKWGW